jgi:uncharacterized RDD family membrane protein YckC
MVENLAGTGKRVLGAIIDLIVLFIIFIPYTFLFGMNSPNNFYVSGLLAIPLFTIFFLYFIIMEGALGKTVGKYLTKTKVVDEAGKKCSWGQSIGRNILRFIDGFFMYLVGFIFILATKQKQRLGDLATKTYVVNV